MKSSAGIGMKAKSWYEVMKPRIVYLLLFTGVVGSILADPTLGHPLRVLLVGLALFLGSAGANVLTCYLDRDIDAIMKRTRSRPIPSGRIRPKTALLYGLSLSVSSLLLAYWLHPLAALFMGLGLLDNVIIYSLWLKRKTPWNIVLGGFSGGMPALVGYSAIAGAISLEAIFLFLLVFIWIPAHIWSLAIRFKEDYTRAGIPMLPVSLGEPFTYRAITMSTLLLTFLSISLPFFSGPGFGPLYLLVALALGAKALHMALRLVSWKDARIAWDLFKFSNLHLTLLFTAIALDALLTLWG